MKAINFPDLVPSSRTYKPGKFAEERFVAQNGAVTRMRYGNRRFNSNLSLQFRNISDDNAALILQHYEDVMEGDNYARFQADVVSDGITITKPNVSDGQSPSLAAWTKETESNLRWKYDGPPQVSSVKPGRSTVSCEFVGELEGA